MLYGPAGFAPLVALKTLKAPFKYEAELVTMLKDEARVAASVRHPNVAAVIDVVEEGSDLVLVMEYVHGESLRGLVRENAGPFPPPIAAAIVCGVLAGLHAAHEACGDGKEPLAIIHRDISPHNVIVGVDGLARVVDFGIAKARGRAQATTQAGTVKGKLSYMPPEQIHGEKMTRQVDVWATGVLFWELLTGKRLFSGADEIAIASQVLLDEILPPSQVAPGVPTALDAIVLRALTREPSRRFATAREMELAIQRSIAIASPPAVGEWVAHCAQDVLETRTRLIESLSGAAVLDDPAHDTQSPPPMRRSFRIGALVALATSLVAIGGTAAVISRGHARAAPAASAPSAAAEPSAEAPPPPSSASAAEPAAAASVPEVSARKLLPAASSGARRTPKTSRPDCDPPYSLNARGEKIYKRECFGGGK
jgi:serine/threonine-protein kinase